MFIANNSPAQESPTPFSVYNKGIAENNYLTPLVELQKDEFAKTDQWRTVVPDLMGCLYSYTGDYKTAYAGESASRRQPAEHETRSKPNNQSRNRSSPSRADISNRCVSEQPRLSDGPTGSPETAEVVIKASRQEVTAGYPRRENSPAKSRSSNRVPSRSNFALPKLFFASSFLFRKLLIRLQ